MHQWEIDLAESRPKFQEERDSAQNECYAEFLKTLGLEHSEKVWDAFIAVWCEAESWGEEREYTYPR